MNYSHTKCQRFLFSLMIVLMTFIQNSFASEPNKMACEIGNKLAKNIYQRVATAYNNENYQAVFANKDDFWDVYQYSSHCTNVKNYSAELISKGLYKNTKLPDSETKIELPKSIQSLCMTSGCVINVTEPGGAISTGIVIPSYQSLTSEPSKGIINWEKNIKKLQEHNIGPNQVHPQDLKNKIGNIKPNQVHPQNLKNRIGNIQN